MAEALILLTMVALFAAGAAAFGWWRSAAECRSVREAERRAGNIVAMLPFPVAFIDADGRYQVVTSGFEEWLTTPAENLVGRTVAEVPGPMADPDLLRHLDAANAGAAVCLELSPHRSAGADLIMSFLPFGGMNRGVVAVLEDVGERRRADADLKTAAATNRAILDAAVDGIITIDGRGLIETFNRAAEKIFGYTAEEVHGRNVSMLMPEPYRSAHDGYLANYFRTGEAKIIGIGREVIGLRKDGSTFPMDLAVGEGRIEGRRIFAGIIRDITERKLTEDRLRQSEDRFRLLVEGVRDYAILILDTNGRVASWNPGAARITGWTADEIVGHPISFFYPPDEDSDLLARKALDTVISTARFEDEGWRMRKDGTRFWCHVVMTPLRGADGALRGFIHIARDMGQQRATQEALRRAKENAERANLAKSKFLAAASHDLRQPVQALFFFAAALERRLRDHPARDVLVDLQRSLDSLNMLLDSLLDISRLDAGIVAPEATTFAVSSLLDRIENEFQPMAAAKGLRLTVVQSTVSIRSDPALLYRVVQNLISNAVRYTMRGRILVGCRRVGEGLRIEVWDTGIGIQEDRLQDIFEEFYQVGNAERDRSHGLGLGLAIVQRLAKLLGHRVEVRSVPGRGSVFSVEVPAVAAPARSRQLGAGADRRRDAGRLVLIIDDEVPVLKALRLILESWGFEVVAATSEDEAMLELQRLHRSPNLILADYRLRGGHTGTEAIRNIRELFHEPIPSIIITGDTAPERLREAEASGLSILHKPVQPPQLHSLLNQTINNGRAAD